MTATAPQRSTLGSLNSAQREAVLYGEGPLLVLAGAGSGKTRVLTTRIAHLIEAHGVRPAEILAVTFTNKAAGEMRERIARQLGSDPAGMWCGTFHALGARLLRRHAPLVGRTASYTIYDEDDTLGVIKRIMERLRISPKERPPQAVASAMSAAHNALLTPAASATDAADPFSADVARVYAEFEPTLRLANAVSFDGLLALPVEILTSHPEVLSSYRSRFRHVLVDEYQDTNRAQYRFVTLMAGASGNVMVVGDDDQSIYGWRGADLRNILDFERDFPSAHVIRLEENYRSTPQILTVANAAIARNEARRGKTLRPTRPAGERVTAVATLDERDEADYVVGEMQRRRFGARGGSWRAFAVLYRTNAQSRAFEEALRRTGIPYRLVGAVRFYDRREIRDMLAYLKLVANPADDEAFRRAIAVPRRGIGETSIEAIAEAAFRGGRSLMEQCREPQALEILRPAARRPLTEFVSMIDDLRGLAHDSSVDAVIREILERTAYLDVLRAEGPEGLERIENVRELMAGAAESVIDDGGEVGLTPLDHFLQRTTLVTGVDALDAAADAVTLMTLHNAKGLEYPVVFLTGLEEGLFPLARARESVNELEEERRLFYVGITRAEDVLFLTHARGRRRNGEFMPSMASSFVRQLPSEQLASIRTPKLRGSGIVGASDLVPRSWLGTRGTPGDDREAWFGPTPSQRRPGIPVARRETAVEDESQDLPYFRVGEVVSHAKFGGGRIVEVSGSGRDAKVTVEFDDEAIGRKRLVVAHAGLSRGSD